MNLRNSQKDVIATIIALIVLIGIFIVADNSKTSNQTSITPEGAYFIEQARDRVVSKIGQPIEGFDQSIFMNIYPGLQESDFTDVETLGDMNDPGVVTSADAAITDYGMAMLLHNVAQRASIVIETQSDVDEVLEFMSNPANGEGVQGEQVVLEGSTLCLPHRDTTGPQTLECAFGLHTPEGHNYALDLSSYSSEAMSDVINTDVAVRVEGLLIPVEALSSDQWQKYDIEGVVRVSNVTQL